ncbi:hypothetical protein FSP39_021136 [Pinctada imbricata]|uniref:PDZ domain-containing protein n=1 Tax=Pinctada imbricata TaxID=66713 RepID=A0AA88XSM0_PINIB|nr:hypothetical protein FSP39_021136 [Pinctada imbricata]
MSNLEFHPAETITVQLFRPDSGVTWGFRLQGGVDFSTPLSVQSVTAHSVAERSGLQAGDGILYINGRNTDALSHEDAKMEIIRSGNQITLTVQRGAVEIWKPKVTPMSELRPQQLNTIKTATGEDVQRVQKTSLTRENQPEPLNIGSGYNRSGKPFLKQTSVESPKQAVPRVVHAQFNSPIGLYSADNIANTYAAQTSGIQQQMQGLDLDRTPVGTKMTGTYQVVDDKGDGTQEVEDAHADSPSQSPTDLQNGSQSFENNLHEKYPQGFRSVRGCICEGKGVPYMPQCFTCDACGINLKQKGYFVVDGQLLCEIHAKQRAQPPGPNMKAVSAYR